jgi:hypothetical protein
MKFKVSTARLINGARLEVIRFIPSGFGIPFGEHPVVTELNAAIKRVV